MTDEQGILYANLPNARLWTGVALTLMLMLMVLCFRNQDVGLQKLRLWLIGSRILAHEDFG